jgi:glucose/arabinose dehydrogenase
MTHIQRWITVLVLSVAMTALLSGCEDDQAPQPNAGAAGLQVETVAGGLVAPWALAFAPDGRTFLTERPGRVRVLVDGALRPEPVAEIADVAAQGEAGLLGLALDPDFATNHRLYLYYTYREGSGLRNRVVSYIERDNRLSERTVILDEIPGSGVHDGGRIAFGPDGKLYVTTGDATQQAAAQDQSSLAGKILRINGDGSIPSDNPFSGSPVYSFGHRNVQGLAWHPETGRLYATEHGPTGNDEVNLIEAGQNYGWPQAQGEQHPPPFRAPIAVYNPAIAPSGATWYSGNAVPQMRGSLLFATLRGTHLHRIALAPDDASGVSTDERLFDGEYGRIRDVVQGPDGALYILTNNRDGRGSPQQGDDRVLRVTAQ